MEQSTGQTIMQGAADGWMEDGPAGSSRAVCLGLLADLDSGRLSPGQRLVETDISARFQVGRNAVREAMQLLAARGIVDLSRHRSPAIRMLSLEEGFEVLDVAEAMLTLAAVSGAARYDASLHAARLDDAVADLQRAGVAEEQGAFARARRHFYRALLDIGGNRELQRLFPAIGMHVLHVQYASPLLQRIRLRDYAAMAACVQANDKTAAALAAHTHVQNVRDAVRRPTSSD